MMLPYTTNDGIATARNDTNTTTRTKKRSFVLIGLASIILTGFVVVAIVFIDNGNDGKLSNELPDLMVPEAYDDGDNKNQRLLHDIERQLGFNRDEVCNNPEHCHLIWCYGHEHYCGGRGGDRHLKGSDTDICIDEKACMHVWCRGHENYCGP